MTLDTAVVGLGVVSETHLRGIEANPRTRLAAVCDLDADRAQDAAREHAVPDYDDVSELLDSEDLDWAHICTPVQTHVDLARRFVRSGIPVLIEKPVAETASDVAELQALASDHSVASSPVHNHVFDPAMRELTGKLESGDIGRVLGVDTIYVGETLPDEAKRGSWVFDLPGGEFEEGLAHPIYLTLAAGGFPRSEDAIDARTFLAREYDHEIEYDGAQVQYVSDDGVLCSAKMLSGSLPQRRLYVHGTEGTLLADFVSQTVVPVERDYTVSSTSKVRYNVDQSLAQIRGTTENGVAVVREQLSGDWESMMAINSHFAQFDAETRALENGGSGPIPLEQSRWTIAVLEELRAAC